MKPISRINNNNNILFLNINNNNNNTDITDLKTAFLLNVYLSNNKKRIYNI